MIQTKNDLKKILAVEKDYYLDKNLFRRVISSFCYRKDPVLWNYQRYLRITEYHKNNKVKSLYHYIMYAIYTRRLNKLGIKLGIEMWENVFDTGLKIHHPGNIIVNGMAKVGKNCQLYGNNCIGNNGKTLDAPVIGNNVELGTGAVVIGGVFIADDIKVAAGAVVIHSFTESGITVAGVPAKKVSK